MTEEHHALDDESQAPSHKVRPLTWVALGFSVLVAAIWWLVDFKQSSDAFHAIFGYDWSTPLAILLILVLVGIALDVGAGWRGRANRAICIVAGVILLSPLALEVYYAI